MLEQAAVELGLDAGFARLAIAFDDGRARLPLVVSRFRVPAAELVPFDISANDPGPLLSGLTRLGFLNGSGRLVVEYQDGHVRWADLERTWGTRPGPAHHE